MSTSAMFVQVTSHILRRVFPTKDFSYPIADCIGYLIPDSSGIALTDGG